MTKVQALALASFGLIAWFILFFHSDGIPGTDGYYLVTQASRIFQSGQLKIHNADPIPFLISATFSFLKNWDWSVKFLYLALLGIGAIFWLRLQISSLPKLLLAIPFVFLVSFHLVEFPKLGIAMLFCFAALLEEKSSLNKKVLGLFFFATACVIHPAALVAAWIPLRLMRLPTWLAACLTAFALLVATYQRGDFHAWPSVLSFLLQGGHSLYLRLALALAVILVLWLVRDRSLLPLAIILFWPASLNEVFSATDRILLFQVLLFSFICLTKQNAPELNWKFSPLILPWPALGALLLLPQTFLPQYKNWTQKIDKLELPMLISSRDFKFYYSAQTGRDAVFFEPESDWPPQRVFRLVQGFTADEILFHGGSTCQRWPEKYFIIEKGAILVREDCWRKVRQSIHIEMDPGLSELAWNPVLHPNKERPQFLKERSKLNL